MSDPTIADACIPLLRGVVYADTQPAAWNALLALPACKYATTCPPSGWTWSSTRRRGMPFCRTPQLPGAGRPTAPDRPSAVDLPGEPDAGPAAAPACSNSTRRATRPA